MRSIPIGSPSPVRCASCTRSAWRSTRSGLTPPWTARGEPRRRFHLPARLDRKREIVGAPSAAALRCSRDRGVCSGIAVRTAAGPASGRAGSRRRCDRRGSNGSCARCSGRAPSGPDGSRAGDAWLVVSSSQDIRLRASVDTAESHRAAPRRRAWRKRSGIRRWRTRRRGTGSPVAPHHIRSRTRRHTRPRRRAERGLRRPGSRTSKRCRSMRRLGSRTSTRRRGTRRRGRSKCREGS
jgi:hypothetical protein